MKKLFTLVITACTLVAVTGCMNPYFFHLLTEPPTTRASYAITMGDYEVILGKVQPSHGRRSKDIFISGHVNNNSKDTAYFILSKIILYSSTDTFRAVLNDPRMKKTYHLSNDTIAVGPYLPVDFRMYYRGGEKYSHRRFRRTHRRDTMALQVNVLGIKDTTLYLRGYRLGDD